MKHAVTVTVLSVVFVVAFCAAGAQAAVKSIWPGSLVPAGTDGLRFPEFVSATDSSAAFFFTELKLPVGAKINKLVYFHKCSFMGRTAVTLSRVKLGNVEDILMQASETDTSGGIREVSVDQPAGQHTAADLVIASGYKYLLKVSSDSNEALVLGIKIYYRPGP